MFNFNFEAGALGARALSRYDQNDAAPCGSGSAAKQPMHTVSNQN
jgi:hypothetical protein